MALHSIPSTIEYFIIFPTANLISPHPLNQPEKNVFHTDSP